MFYPDFKEFIESLNKNKVEYLVVGGYAVALYGLVRTTNDLDIWVHRQAGNAQRLVAALADFGFASLGLKPGDFLEENRIIQLGFEPVRIDIMTDIAGVKFEDCFLRKESMSVDGIPIHLIGLDDLILNKESSARPQDLADAARLKKNQNG